MNKVSLTLDDDNMRRFRFGGMKFDIPKFLLTEVILDRLSSGSYEIQERRATRRAVESTDVVLDLGSGIGAIAMTAAKKTEPKNVYTVEANPNLLPIIRQNFVLNDVSEIHLLHGAVSTGAAAHTDFFLHESFWASTMTKDQDGEYEKVTIPVLSLQTLIKDHKPTVIICDIEGAELHLFETVDLAGVRLILVELHKMIYGQAGILEFFNTMHDCGFVYEPRSSFHAVVGFAKMENAPVD